MADINYVKVGGRMHSTSEDSNPANNHIMAGANEIYDDTKGKKQSVVNAENDIQLASHESRLNAYTEGKFVTVINYSELPDTGAVDTVYRVSSWDGTANNGQGAVDVTKYSEYAWQNGAYKFLAVKTQIGEVFDISEYNSGAVYTDLANALGNNGINVPSFIRRGGMSVKFKQVITPAKYTVVKTEGATEQPTGTELQSDPGIISGTYTAGEISVFSTLPATLNSSLTYYLTVTETVDEQEVTTYTTWVITYAQAYDNKYVQYRLMAQNFTTNVTQWQGVDNEPVANSKNLIESGGVYSHLIGVNVNAINSTLSTPYESKTAARLAVPSRLRRRGMVINYLLSDGWYTEEYNGTNFLDNYWTRDYHWQSVDEEYLKARALIIANIEYNNIDNVYLLKAGGYIATNVETQISLTPANSNDYQFAVIPCIEGDVFTVNGTGGESPRIWAFLNADRYKITMSELTISSWEQITAPTNAAYLVVNNTLTENACVIKGTTWWSGVKIPSSKFDDNSISGEKLTDNTVGVAKIKISDFDTEPTKNSTKLVQSGKIFKSLASKLDNLPGKNLLDVNSPNVMSGFYINASGAQKSGSAYYNISDYIGIEPSTPYHLSNSSDAYICNINGYVAFYDETFTLIANSTVQSTQFTTPATAKYLRCTIHNSYKTDAMLNKGTSRGTYEAYNPVGGYLSGSIPDYSVTINKIAKDSGVTQWNSIIGTAKARININTLASDNNLSISDYPYYIKRGDNVSFYGEFSSFDTLRVGKGYDSNFGVNVKVDNTNVYLCKWVDDGEGGYTEDIRSTEAHGLTLSTFIKVIMSFGTDGKVTYIIQSLGGFFKYTYDSPLWGGMGAVYARPYNMSVLNGELSISNGCLNKNIWVFGDSYTNIQSTRWPYFLFDWGYDNFNLDGLSGASSNGIHNDFERCCNYGCPKFAVWCLGMNDGNDTDEDTPVTKWLTNVTAFISYCNTNGITPILATIPTVPTRNNEGKSKWVRNSGYRYIDFYKAVGANSSGVWYSGYLSRDGVHPSALGGQALATQILIDFPEIMEK